MAKNNESLVERFKNIEDKIFDNLKDVELNIDYNEDRRTIMSNLKAYVKKVKNLEKLLDEYESVSEKLQEIVSEEEKQASITQAVVDMHEDSDELKAEIQNINGEVKIIKKKKKNNTAVKEF